MASLKGIVAGYKLHQVFAALTLGTAGYLAWTEQSDYQSMYDRSRAAVMDLYGPLVTSHAQSGYIVCFSEKYATIAADLDRRERWMPVLTLLKNDLESAQYEIAVTMESLSAISQARRECAAAQLQRGFHLTT